MKINGKKYLVKEVLQYNSDVTINDLKQAGLTFIKEPKYTMIEIEEDNEYCYRTILSSLFLHTLRFHNYLIQKIMILI